LNIKFSSAIRELDQYLKTNSHTISCNALYEIKQDFYSEVESLCGSTANLTGITELLIFRFIYHALGMNDPILNKQVQNENNKLIISNRYIGKNGRFQEPDIVIERDGAIKHLLSIKNSIDNATPTNHERESILVQNLIKKNGVCTNSIQDIFRIDNIRHGLNKGFILSTIVFSKVTQKQATTIDLIHQEFKWHHFIVLEGNHNAFINELNGSLD
jgi:hypothetical protein